MSGFEVFGAVGGALAVINLTQQLLRWLVKTGSELKDAGAQLLRYQKDFEAFVARLESWLKNRWHLTDKSTDEIYVEYWGTSNWISIKDQLTTIQHIMEDVSGTLSRLLPEETLRSLDEVHREIIEKGRSTTWVDATNLAARSGLWAKAKEQRSCFVREIDKMTSRRAKARLVFCDSTRLSDDLTELNDRFTLLRSDAQDLYEEQHIYLPPNQSIQKRRRLAEASLVLRDALQTKLASEILYWACAGLASTKAAEFEGSHIPAGPTLACYPSLEMDLLVRQQDDDASAAGDDASLRVLHYHIVVEHPVGQKQWEVLVEGPKPNEELNTLTQTLSPVDLAQACAMLESTENDQYMGQLPSDPSTMCMFRLMSPYDPVELATHRSIHLSSLLGRIQNRTSVEAHEQFPIKERIHLAFKVAECGLLLLGTPWLSNLNSRQIKRLSRNPMALDGRRSRRFLFEARAEAEIPLSFIEPHTFRIGVLLAEIALGQPVENIIQWRSSPGIELDLWMAHLRRGSTEMVSLPTGIVIERISNDMPPGYCRAVKFCLQQRLEVRKMDWDEVLNSNDWERRTGIYCHVLQDYFSEVYSP